MEQVVRVTWHAVLRLRDRFPEMRETDTASLQRFAASEVLDAVNAGRMATRTPRFAIRPGTTQRARGRRGRTGERDRTIRYVWTAAEDRVYIIDRTKRLTTVLTAIKPGADDTEADVDTA